MWLCNIGRQIFQSSQAKVTVKDLEQQALGVRDKLPSKIQVELMLRKSHWGGI